MSNPTPNRGQTAPGTNNGSFAPKGNRAPSAAASLASNVAASEPVLHNDEAYRAAIEEFFAAQHDGEVPTFVDPPADGTLYGAEPVIASLATPDGVVYDLTHEGKRLFARARATDVDGNPQPFNSTGYGVAHAQTPTPMAAALAVAEAHARTAKTRKFNDGLDYEVWGSLGKTDFRGDPDRAKLDHHGQAVFTDSIGNYVVVKDFKPALSETGLGAYDDYAHEDRMTVVFGKTGDKLADVSGWHDFEEQVEIEVGRDPRTGSLTFRTSADEGSRPIPTWLNEAHSKRCKELGGPDLRSLLVGTSDNPFNPHWARERMSQPDAQQRLGHSTR